MKTLKTKTQGNKVYRDTDFYKNFLNFLFQNFLFLHLNEINKAVTASCIKFSVCEYGSQLKPIFVNNVENILNNNSSSFEFL